MEVVLLDIKEFIKERNEAFFSLDKDKIIAYCKKHNAEIPEDEVVFWAGVRYAILGIASSTNDQREEARHWLISNGFNP